MHQYDVASKILMETRRDEIIRYFAGIDVLESTLIEAPPQETASLKRSDFPVMAKPQHSNRPEPPAGYTKTTKSGASSNAIRSGSSRQTITVQSIEASRKPLMMTEQ